MLFAAEGGGFFSSSASGYSNGLALLFLGRKNEDNPVRVSPWNQYHLVDQEPDTNLHLVSFRNRLSRACTSFICFGRTSAGPSGPSPLKVGPSQPQDVPSGSPIRQQVRRDQAPCIDNVEESKRFALKSSLKKRSFSDAVPADDVNRQDTLDHIERRKVQWPDTCGIDLTEVREFVPSEMGGSDDEEFQHGTGKSCMCSIM